MTAPRTASRTAPNTGPHIITGRYRAMTNDESRVAMTVGPLAMREIAASEDARVVADLALRTTGAATITDDEAETLRAFAERHAHHLPQFVAEWLGQPMPVRRTIDATGQVVPVTPAATPAAKRSVARKATKAAKRRSR